MTNYQKFLALIVAAFLLGACAPNPAREDPNSQQQSNAEQANEAQEEAEGQEEQADQQAGEDEAEESADANATRETPELTNLPIGDDFVTTSGPAVGYVWICQEQPAGGGSESTGDWYDESAGVWHFDIKPIVDGSVNWDSEVSFKIEGNTRHITANGLPDHPTGNYPISSSDDAYQFDTNPNDISAQSYSLELTANPSASSSPNCVGGETGISLDGVVLNNPIDAVGRDAVATEIQDDCQGHPHNGGIYHYHGYSFCFEDQAATGDSALIGYALDGFGIFGNYGQNGEVVSNEDLDECHGHTHAIDWDGESEEMFHYHATLEFPYLVGCYRGEAVQFTDATGTDNSGGGGAGGGNDANGQGGNEPQGDGPPDENPPPTNPPPSGNN